MSRTLQEKARTWGTFWGAEEAHASIAPITTYEISQMATESALRTAEGMEPKIEKCDMDVWQQFFFAAYVPAYKLAAGARIVPGKYICLSALLSDMKFHPERRESLEDFRCHLTRSNDMTELVIYREQNGEILLQEYALDALIEAIEALGIKKQDIKR